MDEDVVPIPANRMAKDLARAMLTTRPDIPIVMTSGYVRPQDRETAQAVGVRDLVLKPDTLEQLGRVLDRVFREQSARNTGQA